MISASIYMLHGHKGLHTRHIFVLIALSAMAALLCNACVFGPEPNGVVDVDHPPYIDPQDIVPDISQQPAVVFNLGDTDRTRQFQLLGVYDWNDHDPLTDAYVLRIGTNTQGFSFPPATTLRPKLTVSPNQPLPFATRYQSSKFSFDPCSYQGVVDGAKYATLQIVIYDTNNTRPLPEDAREQYTVQWTWPLEFHGNCPQYPQCTSDSDCFESEDCVGGTCTPR